MKKKIEKRLALLFLAFCFSLVLSACQQEEAPSSLAIRGDVAETIEVDAIWSVASKTTVEWNEEKVEGVALEALAGDAVLYEKVDWILVAADGFMVRLDGDTIADTFLGYDAERQWFYMSEKHPVNSRVKHIEEIIVVKDEEEAPVYEAGINLILAGENHPFSRGELLAMDYQVVVQTDGFSRSGEIAIEVMKQKRLIPIRDLTEIPDQQALLMSRTGEIRYQSVQDGALELENERVHYRGKESSESMRDLVGIILDPPAGSNMDTYYDAKYYLEHEVPSLVIFLDGFSYEEYQAMCEKHPDYYLSGLPEFDRATSVYHPVTNAGFAAMVTGQPPSVNGVHDRSVRELQCPSIFDKAEELGMDTLLVEGEIKILSLPGKTILNLDQNQNGTSDDEIFETAMAQLDSKTYAYTMVHFHSIDDAGHKSGPEGELTWTRIKEVDGYVRELVENWDGSVIITADHGMHREGDGGSHGVFCAEDLTVPYLTLQGGKANE